MNVLKDLFNKDNTPNNELIQQYIFSKEFISSINKIITIQ